MKSLPKGKGFTLIELLVTITIIAILASVGLTMYSQTQKKARDAKRKQDIEAIAQAFEAHYREGQTNPYPKLEANMFSSGSIPKDPSSNTDYTYTGASPSSSGTYFIVCAKLELGGSGNSSSNTSINTSGSLDYYCRQNQQ